MAVNSTLIDNTQPQTARTLRVLNKSFAIPASGISNGDNVQLTMIPYGQNIRLHSASLLVDATLGASATAKLQLNRGGTRTDLTGATTAGAASRVTSASTTVMPVDLQGGDIIELLIGGANVSSAANAIIDLAIHAR